MAAPDAPTAVKATDGGYINKVTITWTQSAGADAYHILRDSVDIKTLGDVATYDDETAVTGKVYSYQVVAYTGAEASDASTADTGWARSGSFPEQSAMPKGDINMTKAVYDSNNDGKVDSTAVDVSVGGASTIGLNDDVLLTLGTDADGVEVLRSAVLNADTALTGVLIGTPDTHALAANSLIIANKTADGDILIAGNDGGTSRQFVYCDVSVGNIYLGGKDGTPGSATGVGDVYIAGKLEVDGYAYIDNLVTVGGGGLDIVDNIKLQLGTDEDSRLGYFTTDGNAKCLQLLLPFTGVDANNVPALVIGVNATDLGLLDGITQSLLVILEKGGQLHSATDGIADAGGASAILKHVGGFTNAVVGDIVRITAGTLCTAGWYWITTKTSNDQVTLDRNFTSGDTTNVTFVTFHNFPMIGADGVCLKCFDGAPTDANTEIDRDGWLMLDVGSAANGRLYWRSNSAWHYVDATAGFGIPTHETDCPVCNEPILLGQAVAGRINEKLSDNSLHGLWCHLNCLGN
jgi:hypothetical protein